MSSYLPTIKQLQYLVAQDITRALAGMGPRKPVP